MLSEKPYKSTRISATPVCSYRLEKSNTKPFDPETNRDRTVIPGWVSDPRRNSEYDCLENSEPFDSLSIQRHWDIMATEQRDNSGSELSDCYIEDDYIPQLRNKNTNTNSSNTTQEKRNLDEIYEEYFTRVIKTNDAELSTEIPESKRRIGVLLTGAKLSKTYSPKTSERRNNVKTRLRVKSLHKRRTKNRSRCVCTCDCHYCLRGPERKVIPYSEKSETNTAECNRPFSSHKGGNLSSTSIAEVVQKAIKTVMKFSSFLINVLISLWNQSERKKREKTSNPRRKYNRKRCMS